MERALGPRSGPQGPFHWYGTAPWPQINGFWGIWNKIQAGTLGGEVFGQTQIVKPPIFSRIQTTLC